MGISKVILNGVTKVDLTQDTVASNNLLSGETATGADGEAVEGSIASKASADLTVSGATVTAPAGFYSSAASKSVATTTHPAPTASINSSTGVVTASHTQTTGYVTGGTTTGTLQITAQAAKTVTPTESEQTAVAAGRYTTGIVKVGAISSTYVGSDITQRDSDDLTASGATISVPAGYYAEAASKAVASGTAGTPSASKGTVSNHSVSVTPSVTFTAGYITGGMKTGTAVTVNVAELESGTKSITENGTGISVSGYSTVDVNVPSSGGVTVNPLSVTQNGTYTAPSGTAYSPVTVNVEGGGGSSAEEKDVNFIDYDGTVLYSYTASEFANLSALPSNPGHAGLISQGWNWTLAQIRSQLTAQPDVPVWVGQMYITQSGASEIDITLTAPDLHPYLGIAPNGTVVIDWGDGSSTDTVTGTSDTTLKFTGHEYSTAGDYTIKLSVSSGRFAFYNSSVNNRSVMSETTEFNRSNRYSNDITSIRLGLNAYIGMYAFNYCIALTSITIPDDVTSIGTYAFSGCYALKSIAIPDGVTSIGTYAFQNCCALKSIAIPDGVTSIGTYAFQICYSLTSITIPDGVTSIGNNAFQYNYSLTSITIPDDVTSIESSTFQDCYSLTSIAIPDGVTSVGTRAFQNCYALKSIAIPDGVTSIGTYAFNGCYEMAEFHFLPTTPPTLANKNAFTNVPSTCVIYVPAASLEAYQTATNWSTYASQMVGE